MTANAYAKIEARQSETATLAEWAADVTLDMVPAKTLAHARACILDSIGCMIAGAESQPCRTLRAVFRQYGGIGDCVLPGSGQTLPLLKAVHHGAQAANALDFDDSYRDGAPSHPGATVVPAALGMAEKLDAGGGQFLRAVIVGYETSLRIGRAIQPTPRRKADVYGFSTWQIFGAAFAAASLLGLERGQLVQALGLAGVLAPVPSLRKLGTDEAPPLPWIKNTYGAATEGGVLAALLAADGYVGNRTILDGPRGFWLMAGSDRYDPAQLTRGLGEVWLLDNVGFKHYGCCRWTHTMLDALAGIAARVDPVDVEKVEVFAFDELAGLGGGAPTSIVDAQFHAPYLAALELLGRSPANGLRQEDLHDPTVRDLTGRVVLRHDPALDAAFYGRGALPVRVRVHTASGALHDASLEDPTGSSAAGGYPRDALLRKFMRLGSPRLGTERARRVPEVIESLERRAITDLVRLIA